MAHFTGHLSSSDNVFSLNTSVFYLISSPSYVGNNANENEDDNINDDGGNGGDGDGNCITQLQSIKLF